MKHIFKRPKLNLKKISRRTNSLLIAVIFIFTIVASSTIYYVSKQRKFTLSDEITALLSTSDQTIFNNYVFNEQEKTYTLNPNLLPDKDLAQPVQEMVATIGAKTGEQDKDRNIAVQFPENFDDGKVIYDNNMKLRIRMVPQFSGGRGGVDERGYFVYPLKNDLGSVVYTPQGNGIKEDIILENFVEKSLSYSYKLELGDYLEARKIGDGSIGVYSGDPSLFTDATFSSDAEWQEIHRIRKESNKTNLVFHLPAPEIIQSGNNPKGSGAISYFTLEEDVLSVVSERLDQAEYPISIDPTISVTSDSDFLQGNDDNGITYGSNQIARAGLTGAVPTFATTGMNNLTANKRQAGNAIAYNDYMYLVGGSTDGSTFSTTVERATIGGTGLVTSWSTASQTQLTTGRRDHATVQYNGYIYVIGGHESAGGVQSSVLYSQISGGNVGAWSSANSLPAARRALSAVAYNGYIYVVGGDSGTAGTAAQTSFYSAAIKGDGSLGVWTTLSGSNPLPSARFDGAMVASNNALYFIGGDSNSGTATATTYYIFLDGNGGVTGSWIQESTNSNDTINLLTARRQHGAVVNAGYIYVMGGTGTTTNIEYAATNTDGSISNWYNFRTQTSDKVMAGGRSQSSFASYKSWLYAFGGNVASHLNTGEKADIEVVGPVSKVKTANSLPCIRSQSGVATYNGYVYSIGGIGGADCDTVTGGNQGSRRVTLYSKVNDQGQLNSWTASTNLLSEDITLGCAVAHNGYLYKMGGWSNTTSIPNDDVYVSTINSSDGSIGAWTATQNFNRGYRGQACFVYNNRIYAMGGQQCNDGDDNCGNGIGLDTFSNSAKIWIAEPNNDGTISTWLDNDNVGPTNSEGGDLPAASPALRANNIPTFAYNGRVYRVETTYRDIAYNDIDPVYGYIDDSWTFDATDELSTPRQLGSVAVWNGYAYFYGGSTGTGGGDTVTETIEYVKINDDGSLVKPGNAGNGYTSNRINGSNTSISSRDSSMVISRGTVVMLGGCNAAAACTSLADVQYAQINNGGSGFIPTTTAGTSLGTAVINHCSVVVNDYVYIIGGEESGTPVGTVRLAPLSTNGSMGAWSTTNSLPSSATRTKHDCAVINDVIYVVGGSNGSSSQSSVYYGIQSPNGAISWATTTSLNNVRQDLSVTVYNGRLYAVGGYSTSTVDERNDVEYATANANGTIGSWTTDGDTLATKRQRLGAVGYGGYLFVLGGSNGGASPTNLLSDVVVSSIDSGTGAIGAWSTRTELVQPTDDLSAFAVNGFMYVVGGRYSTSGTNNEDFYLNRIATSSISLETSTAHLGAWDPDASLSNYVHQHAVAYSKGYIYVTGGRGGAAGVTPSDQTTARYSGVRSISRLGTYSKLITLTGSLDLNIQTLSYQGTILPNSLISFQFRTACISGGGTFGPTSKLGYLEPNMSESLSQIGHYVLLIVTIDDSQSAAFHDSTYSNITQIDLEYIYGNSDVVDRLFGGKFFRDQVEQPLDTTTALAGGALGCI